MNHACVWRIVVQAKETIGEKYLKKKLAEHVDKRKKEDSVSETVSKEESDRR